MIVNNGNRSFSFTVAGPGGLGISHSVKIMSTENGCQNAVSQS